MVSVSSSFTNSLLNAAGDASKSNAATTMMTTGLGFVRTGMVPLDKKSTPQQKAQVASWMLSATLLSLATQLTVYKGLDKFVDKISIKNLKLNPFKNQYMNLKKLPVDNIEKALKGASSGQAWNQVLSATRKAFDMSNPKEAEMAKKVLQNLTELAKNSTGSAKNVSDDVAKTIVKNVKTIKGANQFFMFLFGAALFTGYVIPTFICKYLPNIMQFAHDHLKINGKPIVPEPKKTKDKKKKSNFQLFGIPLLASGGLLGFLRYHKLNLEKGFGKTLHNAFKKIALWDYAMNPNARIIRNIMTNAVLRPAAALLDGRLFLAAYNLVIELLSAGALLLSKKGLGGAESKKGLIGKIIKKFNVTNIKHAKGIEFLMTHGIQTFLILGVVLGLTTNVVSRHLTNFLKKTLKLKEEGQKENEVPVDKVFPAVAKMNETRFGNINTNTQMHHGLTPQFEQFLVKTGQFKS